MEIRDLPRFVGRNLDSLMKNANDKKYFNDNIEDFDKIKDTVNIFLSYCKEAGVIEKYKFIDDIEEWKQMLKTFERFLEVVSNLEDEFPDYEGYLKENFPTDMRRALLSIVIIKYTLRPILKETRENQDHAAADYNIKALGERSRNIKDIDEFDLYLDFLQSYGYIKNSLDENIQHIQENAKSVKASEKRNEFFQKSDRLVFWYLTDYLVRNQQQGNKTGLKAKISKLLGYYKDHTQHRDNKINER